MKLVRSFPVFSAAFAVGYVSCVYFNLPAFTYFPESGEFVIDWTEVSGEAGPPMFFFGWLVSAFAAAAVLAVASALIPKSITDRVWSGWTWMICLLAMILAAYDMRIWFYLSGGDH